MAVAVPVQRYPKHVSSASPTPVWIECGMDPAQANEQVVGANLVPSLCSYIKSVTSASLAAKISRLPLTVGLTLMYCENILVLTTGVLHV